MSEHGFYNPTSGVYWQATAKPTPKVLSGYPKETVEIPVKPGEGYEWDGTAWSAPSQTAVAATALAALRVKRDAALGACDWTQMPDCPLTDAEKAAWATYRQALRDLPEDGSAWPTEPVK